MHIVTFLALFINGKNALTAVAFPWLQIEERLQVTKAIDQASRSLTVQTIIVVGGGGTYEKCQFIIYKPIGSAPSEPGIAYTSEQSVDLEGAKRLVFFAKGELGGETIKPMIMGKPSSPVSPAPFKNLKFGVVNEDIVLSYDWNRNEMNINGLDLKGITIPVALVISNERANTPMIFDPDPDKPLINNDDPRQISFYLKGFL